MIKQSSVSSNSSGPLKRLNGTLKFNKKEKVKFLSDRYKSVLTPKTYPKCNVEDLTKIRMPGFSDIEFSSGDIYWAL